LLLLKKVKFLSLIFLVAAKIFFIITLRISAVQMFDTETIQPVSSEVRHSAVTLLNVALKVEL